MARPLWSGGLDAPDFEGVPVFDDPLQGFTLFQFQSRSQRCGANKVILAVANSALNDLQF